MKSPALLKSELNNAAVEILSGVLRQVIGIEFL